MSLQSLTLSLCLLLGWCTMGLAAGPRESLWKEVENAMEKGLPKTALEKLEPILQQSLADKAYPEAIKAVVKKAFLEATIQGGQPPERIVRLQSFVDQAPDEMQPVLQAVLAKWYWDFFQSNRWRYVGRTDVPNTTETDITSWSLPRILREVDERFQKALAEEVRLRQTPIEQYEILLEKGTVPDAYRPTLYDFLAHEAIEFYAAGEQAGAAAEDAFELQADSPVFAAVEDFLTWQLEPAFETAPEVKAIRLYQSLLRFHKQDADPSAFIDVDRLRLRFGMNHALGEEATARYQAALKRLAEASAPNPLASMVQADLAESFLQQNDPTAAHREAKVGLALHPDSMGAMRCANLIEQIEAKQVQIATERVWNKPMPQVRVSYRNVAQVHFRLVPFDFEAFAVSDRWSPEQLDQNQRQALIKMPAVASWSADLPATTDYREKMHPVDLPATLKPGAYYLLASHNDSFEDRQNQISFAEVWVSDLAVILRSTQTAHVEGFVLNAISGEPQANARVRAWSFQHGTGRKLIQSTQTDSNGLFRVKSDQQGALLIHAASAGHQLSSVHAAHAGHIDQDQAAREQTVFFTDRRLYRPGQTIQYKGICASIDVTRGEYKVLANRKLTVIFNDANGQEVERVSHQTNAYGSFSGSVTAPRDRLMGAMSLAILEGAPGQVFVQVEEYKRPKFYVELEPPKESVKLAQSVALQGKAQSYTGAAIDGATVRWRVVREVRFPVWWYWRCWWLPPMERESKEIARGTARTAADGTFDLQFTARPDQSVAVESEPTFRFVVYADVVDTAGETRSTQRAVNIGYTSLQSELSAEEWQTVSKPVEIRLSTQSLDGEPQAAKGTVRVYALKTPTAVQRKSLDEFNHPLPWISADAANVPPPDMSNPNSWELGEVVHEQSIDTNASGKTSLSVKLQPGAYRAKYEATDRFGKMIHAELPIQVIDPTLSRLAIPIPFLVVAPQWSAQPESEWSGVWGSGYAAARAFVEVEHAGQRLQSFWTRPGATQVAIKQPINESMRGGLTLRVTMVRENRAYLHSQLIDVPWTNKDLKLTWERFVSKLEPAQKETYTLKIQSPNAQKLAAEVVAGLYDASLDAFVEHEWLTKFDWFRREQSRVHSQFENVLKYLDVISNDWQLRQNQVNWSYRHFGPDVESHGGMGPFGGRPLARGRSLGRSEDAFMEMAAAAPMAMASAEASVDSLMTDFSKQATEGNGANGATDRAEVDWEQVSTRKNLQETAFFYPHLSTAEDGTVRIEFTMPEALTKWKFLAFGHDRELRSGALLDEVVTAKDFMVQPNAPRFVREGDQIEFTAKISNQSPTVQRGYVMLTLMDLRSGEPVNDQLGHQDLDQPFEIAAGQSTAVSWKLNIPDGLGFLTYRVVGATEKLSDGEEGLLPVLSRRVLITESLPLPIRGKQTKTFRFAKLLESADADSLTHESLTVEMTSNPAWYAVMALPYLMEYPHECSEQVFNRLYANLLAQKIANSDEKIARVFTQWREANVLESPLESNPDLKSVLLEETPWVRQAAQESQSRRNVGVLFDENRLQQETSRLLFKLNSMQHEDGAWPWFPGGPANDYITLYITTGMGRLRHLGVPIDLQMASESLGRLDRWMTERFERIKADQRDQNQLDATVALYLYGRSFFLDDHAIDPAHQQALDYWLGQAKSQWLNLGSRQAQGQLALALKRFRDPNTAQAILASLKERSVSDDELGTFWRDNERSWWWYHAPIETQAVMIEAFDEVAHDTAMVEGCKVWLLKQKQTQNWQTTKATADAVYALVLRGTDLLASSAQVEVSANGAQIKPESTEAGTGYYQVRIAGADVQPGLGELTVKKSDEGVAWGAVHWQYLQDMTRVTSHEATPLKISKELFVKHYTAKGAELVPVDGPLEVGDELVTRVVLRSDRDMEYLHLKDYRGSGTEPVNVLSQYRFQDGLGYYESTRDTASHFFIDYLPKGTYVFEYSSRIQLRGQYQTGLANVQCMYAPEFNSHSGSKTIEVR